MAGYFPQYREPLASAVRQALARASCGALISGLIFLGIAWIGVFSIDLLLGGEIVHSDRNRLFTIFFCLGGIVGLLAGVVTAQHFWNFLRGTLPLVVVCAWALLGLGAGFIVGIGFGIVVAVLMSYGGHTETYLHQAMMKFLCGMCAIVGAAVFTIAAADRAEKRNR